MKPPILFIHGAFTRARRWDPWVSYFAAAGYSCVAPSLPGREPPDRRRLRRTDFADYVASVEVVLRKLDRPPIVIGHSMGGLIAQHVAARNECAGLVLISSMPPWRMGATRHAARFALNYVIPVLTGRPVRPDVRAARKLLFHDLPANEHEQLIRNFTLESGRAYRTMLLGRAPIRAGSVGCPVLVVSGGADRLLRPAVAADLATFYNAEHLIIPNRGHSLVNESMIGGVATAVHEWIAGLPRMPRASAASFQPDAVV